jgi:chromosome segregation ATPase
MQKLAALKEKSGELKRLGAERAALVRNRYVPLERGFESELGRMHSGLSGKEKEISELEGRIGAIPPKLSKIGEQARKIAEIEDYARRNISGARVRISSEAARIRETQVIIEGHMSEVSKRLDEQGNRLRHVEKELVRLRKIEQWMTVQQAEIERALEDVSEESKDSFARFQALKSSVGGDYVKRYLRELAALKQRYAAELDAARKEEKGLNDKILSARKEMARLMEESRAAAAALEPAGARKGRRTPEWLDYDNELKEFSDQLKQLSDYGPQ